MKWIKTTWPPRDPHGEQGNKCLVLKTWTFPRALAHRDNVMAEFPFPIVSKWNKMLPGSNIASDQPCGPLFLLSRHRESGMSCKKNLSAEYFSSGVSLLNGWVKSLWLCSDFYAEPNLRFIISNYVLKERDWWAIFHPYMWRSLLSSI